MNTTIPLQAGYVQYVNPQEATFILENDETTESLDIVSLTENKVTETNDPIIITEIQVRRNNNLTEIITIPKTVMHIQIEYNAKLTHMPQPENMPLKLTSLFVMFNTGLQFVPKGIVVTKVSLTNFRESLGNLDDESFENVKEIMKGQTVPPRATFNDVAFHTQVRQEKEKRMAAKEAALSIIKNDLAPLIMKQPDITIPLLLRQAQFTEMEPKIYRELEKELYNRERMRPSTKPSIKVYYDNPIVGATVGGKRRKSRKRHRSNKNRRTRKPRRSLRRKYSRK